MRWVEKVVLDDSRIPIKKAVNIVPLCHVSLTMQTESREERHEKLLSETIILANMYTSYMHVYILYCIYILYIYIIFMYMHTHNYT